MLSKRNLLVCPIAIILTLFISTNSMSLKFFQVLKAVSDLVEDQTEMREKIDKINLKANLTYNLLASNYAYFQSLIVKELRSEFESMARNLTKKIDSLALNFELLSNQTNSNTKKILELQSKVEKSATNQFRFFRIISANNSKCLTDTGKGNQVSLQECQYEVSNPSQAWKILPSEEGWYSIVSANNNSLDVPNGKKFSGYSVQTWDVNLGNAQRWVLDPVGDFFYIRFLGSTCLRLDFSVETSQVMIFECKAEDRDKGNNQKFYLSVIN